MRIRISHKDLYKAVFDNFTFSFDQKNGVQLTSKAGKEDVIFYFCGCVEAFDDAGAVLNCTYNPEDEMLDKFKPVDVISSNKRG